MISNILLPLIRLALAGYSFWLYLIKSYINTMVLRTETVVCTKSKSLVLLSGILTFTKEKKPSMHLWIYEAVFS